MSRPAFAQAKPERTSVNKFNNGDKVLIARKFDSVPGLSFNPEMDSMIGKIATVLTVKSSGYGFQYMCRRIGKLPIGTSDFYWTWPESSLEPMEERVDIPGLGKVTLKLKGVAE